MPITTTILEHISTAEDQQDLLKIYQDYPGFDLEATKIFLQPWSTSKPNSLKQDSIQPQIQQQEDEKSLLVVGRFNDRLLGAGVIDLTKEGTDYIWHLHHLCVRSITRRRGVAIDILRQLLVTAKQQGASLQFELPDTFSSAENHLKTLGFHQPSSSRQWTSFSASISDS